MLRRLRLQPSFGPCQSMNGIISGRVAPLCPMREEETVTESKTKYCLSPSSLPLPRLRSTLSVRERWNREKSLSLPRRVFCALQMSSSPPPPIREFQIAEFDP